MVICEASRSHAAPVWVKGEETGCATGSSPGGPARTSASSLRAGRGVARRPAPEFKRSVLHCYRGKNAHYWHYGLSSRLEDQSHLKTSYESMVKLSRTKSKSREWYKAEAEHIATLWPRAKGDWEGLSNQAGSI